VKINIELEIGDAGCAQQPFDLLAAMIGWARDCWEWFLGWMNLFSSFLRKSSILLFISKGNSALALP
jgi:hypothetical protein